jgi:two-component system, NarL family, sensor histidine kinase DesK
VAVPGPPAATMAAMAAMSTQPDTGLTSFRRYTWWSLAGTTAFVLVVLLGRRILTAALPVWAAVACLAAVAVTTVASVVLLGRRLAGVPPDGQPVGLPVGWVLAGSGGAAVLGVVLLLLGDDGEWSVAPVTMVAVVATFLPPRRRWVLLAAAAPAVAVLGGIAALVPGPRGAGGWLGAVLLPPALLAITAVTMLGMLWGWEVAARLERARRLSAELAVKDERLRFAADLHDIQGHHLQVIALKSELAARLAASDPARAAEEMRQVQRLSRDALRDTRAVVQGYRRTALDEEITNATRVMTAADIDARMQVDADAGGDRLSETSRHLLGLVVREATTNVLRHSRARSVAVDYRVTAGMAQLRMCNDGAVAAPNASPGSGLRTLAGRLEAAGGRLTWEQDGDRFVVAASLPVDARAGAEAG